MNILILIILFLDFVYSNINTEISDISHPLLSGISFLSLTLDGFNPGGLCNSLQVSGKNFVIDGSSYTPVDGDFYVLYGIQSKKIVSLHDVESSGSDTIQFKRVSSQLSDDAWGLILMVRDKVDTNIATPYRLWDTVNSKVLWEACDDACGSPGCASSLTVSPTEINRCQCQQDGCVAANSDNDTPCNFLPPVCDCENIPLAPTFTSCVPGTGSVCFPSNGGSPFEGMGACTGGSCTASPTPQQCDAIGSSESQTCRIIGIPDSPSPPFNPPLPPPPSPPPPTPPPPAEPIPSPPPAPLGPPQTVSHEIKADLKGVPYQLGTSFGLKLFMENGLDIESLSLPRGTYIETAEDDKHKVVVIQNTTESGCTLSQRSFTQFKNNQGYTIYAPEDFTLTYNAPMPSNHVETLRLKKGLPVSYATHHNETDKKIPLTSLPNNTFVRKGTTLVKINTNGDHQCIVCNNSTDVFYEFEVGEGYIISPSDDANLISTP